MGAPSPDLIVTDPAPLNAAGENWPFVRDAFPARRILTSGIFSVKEAPEGTPAPVVVGREVERR